MAYFKSEVCAEHANSHFACAAFLGTECYLLQNTGEMEMAVAIPLYV